MATTHQPPGGGGSANPGWYRDPWGRSAWRWWDGWQWSGWVSPPESANPAIIRQLAVDSKPRLDAPPEAPARERLPGGGPGGVWGPEWFGASGGSKGGGGQAAFGAAAGPTPSAYGPPPPIAVAEQASPVPRSQRKRLRTELLVVLAIFPLPATLAALQLLSGALLHETTPNRLPDLFPGHTGVAFPFLFVEIFLPLAAGALVLYLLSTSNHDHGAESIGIGKRNGGWRADLALILPVFGLAFVVPQYGIGLALRGAGVHGISPGLGHFPAYYLILDIAIGWQSAVVEELVVLGYLVRRLEQLGVRPVWVVIIAAAVRGSYHLYYGWGVLPILAWAIVSVVLYQRWRRLMPFIIVHLLWDTSVTLAQAVNPIILLVEFAVLVGPTIAFLVVWRHYIPRKVPPLPPPAVL